RARQVPPARRLVGVRRARAHGAGLLAALPARGRAGELRLQRGRRGGGVPVHRGAPDAHRHRDAGRHREEHRRLRPQLRRPARGAEGAAVGDPEPARQRVVGDRRGDGDEHPAAQHARDRRRAARDDRQPRDRRGGAAQVRQGPRLPDRRLHLREGGDQRLPGDRARADRDARAGGDRGEGELGPLADRRHRGPVPGERAHDAGGHRAARARGEAPGHRRHAQRDEPRGDAHRHRAEARRHPARGAQPAVQAHRDAVHVRREHARARARREHAAARAEGDGAQGGARALHQAPARGHRPAHAVRPREGARPRAHPRGAQDRRRQHRRGDQDHPRRGRHAHGERAAAAPLQALRAPGGGDPQHAPRQAHRPRDREARGGAGRGARDDRRPARHPRLARAPLHDHEGRAAAGGHHVRRRAPHRDHRRPGRVHDRGPHRRGGHGRDHLPLGLHQAHVGEHLPHPAARRARALGAGPQGHRLHRAAVRGEHPRLHPDLHRRRPLLLAQGARDPAGRARHAREAHREPHQRHARHEDPRDGAGARLPRRPVPAVRDQAGHGEEDRALGLLQPARQRHQGDQDRGGRQADRRARDERAERRGARHEVRALDPLPRERRARHGARHHGREGGGAPPRGRRGGRGRDQARRHAARRHREGDGQGHRHRRVPRAEARRQGDHHRQPHREDGERRGAHGGAPRRRDDAHHQAGGDHPLVGRAGAQHRPQRPGREAREPGRQGRGVLGGADDPRREVGGGRRDRRRRGRRGRVRRRRRRRGRRV
ncbi:MAG: DNA gyrase subunit A, partial [uncultured Gemmatimonadaceae bacterium]